MFFSFLCEYRSYICVMFKLKYSYGLLAKICSAPSLRMSSALWSSKWHFRVYRLKSQCPSELLYQHRLELQNPSFWLLRSYWPYARCLRSLVTSVSISMYLVRTNITAEMFPYSFRRSMSAATNRYNIMQEFTVFNDRTIFSIK